MAAPTKNQKIEALVKLVQKKCRGQGVSQPPQRTVLETLMYAALFENATFDKADIAYTVLENYYIDWNEIRVCSVHELADTLIDLPHPESAAERVRKALQGIFEKTYMFELEEMRKKGKALAEHIKTLESMSAGTPYMIQYTAQVALDGHLIPLDEASLRIMRRLGLSQVSSDGTQEVCLGLDRVILKKSGLTFAAQLHHFAAGYYDVPDSSELLSLLSTIDPAAVERSWASPILTPPPAPPQPAAIPVPPVSPTKAVPPKAEVPKPATPAVPKTPPKTATPAAKPVAKPTPAKPAAKPVKKPAKKPLKKSVPVKPLAKKTIPQRAAVKPVKPVKSSAKVKASAKVSKGTPLKRAPAKKTPGKKAVKKVVKNTSVKKVPKKAPPKKVISKKPVKPAPTTRKAILKPVKKTKSVSPSKALRKKKPK